MYNDTPSPILYSNSSVEVNEELIKHANSVYKNIMNKNLTNYCEDQQTLTKPCFHAWNLSAYLWKLLKGYIKHKSINLTTIRSPVMSQCLDKVCLTQTKGTVTTPLQDTVLEVQRGTILSLFSLRTCSYMWIPKYLSFSAPSTTYELVCYPKQSSTWSRQRKVPAITLQPFLWFFMFLHRG